MSALRFRTQTRRLVAGKPKRARWGSTTTAKEHRVCLEGVVPSSLSGLLALSSDGYCYSVHSVTSSYVIDIWEAENIMAVRKGNGTSMPCYGCQAFKPKFVPANVVQRAEFVSNSLASILHWGWVLCKWEDLWMLFVAHKARLGFFPLMSVRTSVNIYRVFCIVLMHCISLDNSKLLKESLDALLKDEYRVTAANRKR